MGLRPRIRREAVRAWEDNQHNAGTEQCDPVSSNHLHTIQGTPLLRVLRSCRPASTVIHQLPKATFTLSAKPNLRLPRTRTPLTSATDIIPAIRYSAILTTCPSISTLTYPPQRLTLFLFQRFNEPLRSITISNRVTSTILIKHLI